MPEPGSGSVARLERWTGWGCDAAGLMLVAMAILINVEIVARGVFNKSTLLADEYSGYLFVWMTLIGFGHALQTGAFLRVEALVTRLSPKPRAWADLVSAAVGLVVALICTYATGTLVRSSIRFGSVSIQPSATPLWAPQIIMPLGFLLLVVLYGALLLQAARRLGRPAAPSTPAGRSA